MRLLLFAQSFLPVVGGAERFLDQLARRLVERRHDVTLLAAGSPGEREDVETPYRLIRYPKPFSKRILPRHTVVHLAHAALRARPDCVHVHGAYPTGYAAELFCRWTRLPWALRPIGGDVLPDEGVRRRGFGPRVAQAVRGAGSVIAQSRDFEAICAELGAPRERIVRIPNAVDPSPFDACTQVRAPEPLVVALGMLFAKKGFDVLLDAMRTVRARHPRARLVVAGEGRERAVLEAQVARLGLQNCVSFPGVVDGEAKVRLLRSAWVFVSSARREPFSNANLEALAAGLPLVAAAVGGNLEIVEEGQNGRLVPVGDARAMGAAIADLLGDPAVRERMGSESRRIAARYPWAEVVERYEAVYRDLASRPVRARSLA